MTLRKTMTTTNTSEGGLEALIVAALTGPTAGDEGSLRAEDSSYVSGLPQDYDRDHALDIVKLFEFLNTTQPEAVSQLDISMDGPKRLQFLNRLQGEITKHGVVQVL